MFDKPPVSRLDDPVDDENQIENDAAGVRLVVVEMSRTLDYPRIACELEPGVEELVGGTAE